MKNLIPEELQHCTVSCYDAIVLIVWAVTDNNHKRSKVCAEHWKHLKIPSLKSHLNVSHFQECFSSASANSDEEAFWLPQRMWPVFLSSHPRMQKCLQTAREERVGQRERTDAWNWETKRGEAKMHEWKYRRSKVFSFSAEFPVIIVLWFGRSPLRVQR